MNKKWPSVKLDFSFCNIPSYKNNGAKTVVRFDLSKFLNPQIAIWLMTNHIDSINNFLPRRITSSKEQPWQA
jgi:hypothetical protein